MHGYPKWLPIAFSEYDIVMLHVVLNLKQPTARYFIKFCLIIVLFDDIYPVFGDANVLCQEVEADVLTVKRYLNGLHVWIPGHTHAPAYLKR